MKVSLYIYMALCLAACTRPVCEVETVRVEQPRTEKKMLKSDIEFISIAYYDLLNRQITNTELDGIYKTILGIGDKALIGRIVLDNLVDQIPEGQLPPAATMRADIDAFVQESYNRFYKREPNEFESWYLKQLIVNDTTLTPLDVYYSFVCSDEYQYF